MNIDCIFNVLQFSDCTMITKVLSVNKDNVSINTLYFWKLLCERDKIKINKKLSPNKIYKNYYNSLKTEFKYGRCYQFVIDNLTNNILSDYYNDKSDEFDIIGFMNSKAKVQVINEAINIIRKNNIKLQNSNKFIKYHNKFYLGRCVQFIIDFTIEINFDQLIIKSPNAIIKKAHIMKAISLLNREISFCIMCHRKFSMNTEHTLDGFAVYGNYDNRIDFICFCSTTVFTVTFIPVSHLDVCYINCDIINKKITI